VDDAHYLSTESWAGRSAPFWQPPLYPYTLALLFRLFGENYYFPLLLQALCGALICILIYVIGYRVFSPAVALGASLGAALYGPLIYFGGELLPTILAIFLDLLLLLFLLHLPSARSWPWLAAGLLLGLSALAVANILLFLPFLIFWLWHTHGHHQLARDQVVWRTFLLLLGCALALAPVTLRNYWVGHDLVLISHNAGINFYIGNNPDYDRTVNIRPGRDWARLVETPEIEAGIERPSAKSRYFLARSWEFATSDPAGFVELLVRKFYLFWHGNEPLRNLDPYYARNDSLLLRILLWKHGLAFPFGLVAPLALLGIVAFWHSPSGRTSQGYLLLLFLLAYLLSVVLFFVTSRYRLPAVPLLLLFAGYGVKASLLSVRWLRSLLWLLLLLVLANVGAGPMDMEGDAHQHFWLGYAYEQKSMPANAIREYQTALERRPDHEDALLNLAALYASQAQYSSAIELYQQFLQFFPEAVPVRFILGNTYLRAGRYKAAIAVYENLVLLRPQWADLHGRLGYAYLMSGHPDRAIASYCQTLALNPDSSLVRYQLARIYEIEGKIDAAVEEYRLLLVQEPDNPDYHTRLADLLIAQEKPWLPRTIRPTSTWEVSTKPPVAREKPKSTSNTTSVLSKNDGSRAPQ
jgi:tetratricopeptide (TPR) repeat protein